MLSEVILSDVEVEMKSDQSLHCLFYLIIDLAWPSSTRFSFCNGSKVQSGEGKTLIFIPSPVWTGDPADRCYHHFNVRF